MSVPRIVLDRDYITYPGQLQNLWEIMQRFRAPSFAAAMSALGRAVTAVRAANYHGVFDDAAVDRRYIREALDEAMSEFADIPLSPVVQHQVARLHNRIDSVDGQTLATLMQEVHENVIADLCSAWFLMIPHDKREYYEQRGQPFGQLVADTFPSAVGDIAAASRCFALDEWTACVFHLMRVLEHGLRSLAMAVGLGADAMSHENWKNVIDQIEKQIRAMENEPKTPEKVERIQRLSSAAAQFRYFKDAWRNHVSHSHASYGPQEGERAWIHVKAFMEQAATP